MNILVLNGSPKGEYSVTLLTVLYWEKLYPRHTFEVLHVGQRIKALERDFSQVKPMVERADLLLFSYPVYTFIAPCQLHRFIELLKESDISLKGKFVTQLTTSKHFYDVTAHRYIQDNCQDMKMKYIRGLSADMDDLLSAKGQKEARDFFKFVYWSMKNNAFETLPAEPEKDVHMPVSIPKNQGRVKKGDVVIVTDCKDEDVQLSRMIARFRAVLPLRTRVVNLREYPFKGGCLGCFNCAVSGKCIYKDGFDSFLREEIQNAQSIVYAFSIKDHSMGALFKMYDDRQFCNGHRTVTEGMPFAYLINGDYNSEHNLKTIVEARAEVGHNYLAGVGLDSESIEKVARKLEYALAHNYVQPRNIYGVGGMKIFRDLIWVMRGIMKADHKFYKKHGVYDFPQKQRGKMLLMCFLGALIRNKKIKAKMGNMMNEGMVAPYKKVIEKLKKEAK